jgi:flavodoxin
MKIAIVFESMFGNTEALTDAVALGLRDRGAEVTIHRAGDAGDHVLRGCDLLVLAAPTHALTLSA